MAALRAWKQADLSLYAVPVFENHPLILSLPKQADTTVSGYGLDWKWAFWACFRKNDRFHAQNWVYKFGHWTRPHSASKFTKDYTSLMEISRSRRPSTITNENSKYSQSIFPPKCPLCFSCAFNIFSTDRGCCIWALRNKGSHFDDMDSICISLLLYFPSI